jgi:N-acetylmuramoyl-L-alanine amidase
MLIIKDHLPVGKVIPIKGGTITRRPGTVSKKTSITIHNTGNPDSTAYNERAWLENLSNTASASYHAVVHERTVIEVIPDNEEAYHSATKTGNLSSFSIEVCESGDYNTTLITLMEYLMHKMEVLDLTPKDITTHKAWSGKECPRLLLPVWDSFMKAVEGLYGLMKKEEVTMEVIKFGSKGPAVGLAQKYLGITVDNSFGPNTKAAVIAFQKRKGLVPDGVVGPITWNALKDNDYFKHGKMHVKVVDPLDLKIVEEPNSGRNSKLKNAMNASFIWWTDSARKDPYITSIVAYKGRLLRNKQPNGYAWQKPPHYTNGAPTPMIIVGTDGKVTMKNANDLSKEVKDIHVAVTGLQLLPSVSRQGFEPYVTWSSVAYRTARNGIGFKDGKVYLCHHPSATAEEMSKYMKAIGCEFAISPDSGGSANFIIDGEKIYASTRMMRAWLTW